MDDEEWELMNGLLADVNYCAYYGHCADCWDWNQEDEPGDVDYGEV